MFITEWMRRPAFSAASRIPAASSSLTTVCISIASNPASRATAKRSAYGRSFGSSEIRVDLRIVPAAAGPGPPAAWRAAGPRGRLPGVEARCPRAGERGRDEFQKRSAVVHGRLLEVEAVILPPEPDV